MVYQLKLVRILAFLFVVQSTGIVEADFIVNGDFEVGNRSGWVWTPQPNVPDAVVSFDVFGSDGPSLAFQMNPTASPVGFNSVLSQQVFLEAGTEYQVSWEQAMQNLGPDSLQETGRIEVRLGGVVLNSWFQGFLNANSFSGLRESKTFTPTSSDFNEIAFLFQRAPNPNSANATINMYIDNVSIVSTVPEPSSLTLLGIGAVGIVTVTCRRKRTRVPGQPLGR